MIQASISKKINRRKWITGAALLSAAAGVPAQVSVVKSADGLILLDLSPVRTGPGPQEQLFMQVLRNDLSLSGRIRIVSAGAEYRLAGEVEASGGVMTARLGIFETAGNRSLLGRRWSGPAEAVRTLAHQAADAIIYALTGEPGIASGRLVFVGTRSGHKELYLADADGANVRQLTRDRSISVAPKWGPDGKQLVYTSFLQGNPDVYLLEPDTGRRRRISAQAGLNANAAIAPNGQEVALILSLHGNPELYVQELNGRGIKRLSHTRTAVEASPSWAPDGRSLVYVSDESGRPQLSLVSRTGGPPQRLTRGGEHVSPHWGPNGWIACSTRSGGRYRIKLIHPQSGQSRELPTDGADYEDPCWAPDGRHIVCTRTERYRSTIYRLDTQNGPPIGLISISGDWFSPSWAPRN